jgi:hypothetical protein
MFSMPFGSRLDEADLQRFCWAASDFRGLNWRLVAGGRWLFRIWLWAGSARFSAAAGWLVTSSSEQLCHYTLKAASTAPHSRSATPAAWPATTRSNAWCHGGKPRLSLDTRRRTHRHKSAILNSVPRKTSRRTSLFVAGESSRQLGAERLCAPRCDHRVQTSLSR